MNLLFDDVRSFEKPSFQEACEKISLRVIPETDTLDEFLWFNGEITQ